MVKMPDRLLEDLKSLLLPKNQNLSFYITPSATSKPHENTSRMQERDT